MIYLEHKRDFSYKKYLLRFLLLLGVVMSFLPFSISAVSSAMPMFEIISIYYWSMHNNESLSPWFVFTFGLLYDIMADCLGLTALICVVIHYFISDNLPKLIRLRFSVKYLLFIVVVFIVFLVKWVLLSLIYWQYLPADVIMISVITSIIAYPLIHYLFDKINYYLL